MIRLFSSKRQSHSSSRNSVKNHIRYLRRNDSVLSPVKPDYHFISKAHWRDITKWKDVRPIDVPDSTIRKIKMLKISPHGSQISTYGAPEFDKLRLKHQMKGPNSKLPDLKKIPEVAFIGRSNVGKSYLINCLTSPNTDPGRKIRSKFRATASFSDIPGHTREINFYKSGDSCYFVDMPGYGFAEVDEATKMEWEKLWKSYFVRRLTLKKFYMLIDSKWGLLKADRDFLDFVAGKGVYFDAVFTKCDQVHWQELAKRYHITLRQLQSHPEFHGNLHMVSAKTNGGTEQLSRDLFRTIGKPIPHLSLEREALERRFVVQHSETQTAQIRTKFPCKVFQKSQQRGSGSLFRIIRRKRKLAPK